MKKLCNISLTIIIFLLIAPIHASANDLFYKEAYDAVNNYIDKSVQLGQLEWQGFTISDYHEIYDNQLNRYGYIFELNSNTKPGYVIVTCDEGICSVMEASYDSASPYKDFDKNYKYVYINALEYFVAEPVSKVNSNIKFKNVETNKFVNINQSMRLRATRDVDYYIPFDAKSYEAVRYVDDYKTHFKAINQNTSYNCVATSMAMCLNYLNNKGRLSFHDLDPGNSNVEKVRNTITGYYAESVGSDIVVRTAINAFGSNNCNPKITTKDDGFCGNSPTTDISFNTIIAEINDNCPMVMMFNPGVFNGIYVNHATACFGYKRINETSVPTDYTIVKVPQNTSSIDVMTKEVQWCYANVHGYYLVYIW